MSRVPGKSWTRSLFLVLTGLVAVYALLSIAATAIVRARLTDAVSTAGARIVGDPQVVTSLFGTTIELRCLALEPLASTSVPDLTISGTIDTLKISGISVWGLLRGRVHADRCVLRTRDLVVRMVNDTSVKRTVGTDRDAPSVLSIDLLDLRLESTRFGLTSMDTSEAFVKRVTCLGAGVTLIRNAGKPWRVHLPGTRSVSIDSLHVDIRGMQHFDLSRFRLDQASGECEITAAVFGPDTPLENYAALQDLERDVAAGVFPRILFTGIHIPEHLEEQNWSAVVVEVDSADIRIARDKTRPDGAATYMPLVARILRALPMGAGVDSLKINNTTIVYSERATHERGFGQVSFHSMNALATGMRNLREDTAECTVHATCVAFQTALVDFDLRTRVQDTTDRFLVVAHIGRMPFRDINVAFGPLADMQAVSGTLDTVVLRLDADDRLSRGKVRLAYRDLRMVQGDVANGKARSKPLSVLMNVLIPNDKERGDIEATDARYTLLRRRDRSMFNYLWINLREGSKKVVLPGFLEKD